MKTWRIFVLAMILALAQNLTSCVYYAFSKPNFVKLRNDAVGRNFFHEKAAAGLQYTRLYISDEFDGYETYLSTGCSWMYVVRKSDDVIVSWKYTTENIELCRYERWGGP